MSGREVCDVNVKNVEKDMKSKSDDGKWSRATLCSPGLELDLNGHGVVREELCRAAARQL